jgi:hypothetical protein
MTSHSGYDDNSASCVSERIRNLTDCVEVGRVLLAEDDGDGDGEKDRARLRLVQTIILTVGIFYKAGFESRVGSRSQVNNEMRRDDNLRDESKS